MCVVLGLYKGGRDKRMRSQVKGKGLQQVLLLALAGVVPVEEGLLHLAMFVQAACLVGEIRTYIKKQREKAREQQGDWSGEVRW